MMDFDSFEFETVIETIDSTIDDPFPYTFCSDVGSVEPAVQDIILQVKQEEDAFPLPIYDISDEFSAIDSLSLLSGSRRSSTGSCSEKPVHSIHGKRSIDGDLPLTSFNKSEHVDYLSSDILLEEAIVDEEPAGLVIDIGNNDETAMHSARDLKRRKRKLTCLVYILRIFLANHLVSLKT